MAGHFVPLIGQIVGELVPERQPPAKGTAEAELIQIQVDCDELDIPISSAIALSSEFDASQFIERCMFVFQSHKLVDLAHESFRITVLKKGVVFKGGDGAGGKSMINPAACQSKLLASESVAYNCMIVAVVMGLYAINRQKRSHGHFTPVMRNTLHEMVDFCANEMGLQQLPSVLDQNIFKPVGEFLTLRHARNLGVLLSENFTVYNLIYIHDNNRVPDLYVCIVKDHCYLVPSISKIGKICRYCRGLKIAPSNIRCHLSSCFANRLRCKLCKSIDHRTPPSRYAQQNVYCADCNTFYPESQCIQGHIKSG